ncbi:phosphonatase-like hydrolase [Prauserella sp. PE36]|uniref:phosphonatase-like hydrolase n=1 Tax=Prauserella sp. PE36 TaxID=1504709 RepID=UPI000D942103|nr:phosphonatase-like hydrolase [Prauserella sp. PE36]PXY34561.1 HAD family hydrolase [Prauserella coralliicola]RBM12981.1 phosphonatase-like hydrolase [Prauserella sp. PE36]
MIELAVFDIAGTTVEERNAVYTALEEAVVAAGGAPSKDDIQRWMGAGKREAITAMLTESTGRVPSADVVDQGLADFRARLAAAYSETPPVPLPGVPEAIASLRAAGVKVALTTGFEREVVDALLKTVGWDETVIDAVVCVDDVPAGRPAPYMIFRAMERTGVRDVRKVLAAGDTARDLEAGTNAGAAYVVGVLTGGYTAADLGRVNHTHLLPSVAEVPTLLGL